MRQRILYGLGVALLAFLVMLLVWQTSFTFGDFSPGAPSQVYLLWALSTVVFLLTVTLGFMLFRAGVKILMERQTNWEGSRIRTKLVVGALTLTFLPVVFLVLFSFTVLNRNLDKWFSRPAQNVHINLAELGKALEREVSEKAVTQARWLASLPEIQALAAGDPVDAAELQRRCTEGQIVEAALESGAGKWPVCQGPRADGPAVRAAAPVGRGSQMVVIQARLPVDVAERQKEIARSLREYEELAHQRKQVRYIYLLLLSLISLFILFVATWVALFMARQISVPISALLAAAREVRSGNLAYRVKTPALDELAGLVRAFNEMTQDLEANERELELRHRFTEAILEAIPTGVISVTSDGRIRRVNRALLEMFPGSGPGAYRLEDLFAAEDAQEIRYLMKRARRTGAVSRPIDLKQGTRTLHLAVTVAAIDEKAGSGLVVVLEDTSELMRAQRVAAWQEVARRVAHEIKNPLTPISLSADRIVRQLDRGLLSPDSARILRECSVTISSEVESVRTLVDAFSQLARFPAAQLAPGQVNDAVESAMAVFQGRLEGIQVHVDLAAGLPLVMIDHEQIKRVVVNLVDNAAEAMQSALVKRLYVGTVAGADAVELVVSDTGPGITPEDRERLFLPYFSTKARGTGLGLAIVSHIVTDHSGQVRVEENRPAGARFVIELPAIADEVRTVAAGTAA
ncbi:MAG: HAMP domain-containing protein [Acidobacteria bacterium]|nr:HAMP domain-containing protein [Acidobacteriota bacterium]